jgi:hypothetical protein
MATFEENSLVWTKVKGFPWWPSKIESEETLPKHILNDKPFDNAVPVLFFKENMM